MLRADTWLEENIGDELRQNFSRDSLQIVSHGWLVERACA